MWHKYSVFLFTSFFSLTILAQNTPIFGKKTAIDTPYIECIYEQYLADTVTSKNKLGPTILCVGNKWSKYFDYGAYQQDSTFQSLDYNVSRDTFNRISDMYMFSFFDYYERNLNNNHFCVFESFNAETFTYLDSTATPEWTLRTDTLTLCGHLCRKATTRFRGINWTAWYAADIPVDAGPWKLNGLPGLILAAEDEDELRSFSAVQIRKAGNYPIIKYANPIAEKTTREKAVELNRFISLHYDDFMAAKGWDKTPDGSRIEYPKRKFYCPLEKE